MVRIVNRLFSKTPHGAAIKALLVFLLLIFAAAAYSTDLLNYAWIRSLTDKLSAPSSVAIAPDQNIYVAESSSDKILVYNKSGKYVKELSGLDRPLSVAVDGYGRIYAANGGRGNVEVYGPKLSLLLKLGVGDGEFSMPSGIALDASGNAYVTDGKRDRVQVYNAYGKLKFTFDGSDSKDGRFHFPTSIAIDMANGEVYVTDLQVIQTRDGMVEGARVQVFGMDGAFRRSFGSYGQGEGKLTKPMGIGVDDSGRVYVTDAYQNVAQVFDRYGAYLGTVYDTEHPMRTPMGLAVGSGRIFIASLNTGKVEIFGVKIRRQPVSQGQIWR